MTVSPLRIRRYPELTLDLPTKDELVSFYQATVAQYMPDLTDMNMRSKIMQLGNVVAANYNRWQLNRALEIVREGFIVSASDYNFLTLKALEHGYVPSPGNGATVKLRLTRRTASSVPTVITRTDYAYYSAQSGDTERVRFEMVPDSVTIPAGAAGTEIYFEAVQGTTITRELLGESDNTELQQFTAAYGRAVSGSLTVTVEDPAGISEDWTLVTNLAEYGEDDKVYEVRYTESGQPVILFGTGDYGKIPVGFIYLTYRIITDGQDGNVPGNSISAMAPSNTILNVINDDPATGWAPAPDIETIRFHVLRAPRINYQCCSPENTPLIVERDFSAQVGRCYTVAEFYGENTLALFLLDGSGNAPIQTVIDDVVDYVDRRNPGGEMIYGFAAQYQDVTIAGTVECQPGYTAAETQTDVEDILDTFYDPLGKTDGNWNISPGGVLYPDAITAKIRESGAVLRVTLTSPTQPIAIASSKLPRLVLSLTYTETEE